MDTVVAVAAGVLVGFAGFAWPGALFERALVGRRDVRVGAGLASVVASYLMQFVALLVAYAAATELFLEFACSMVAAFLALWGIEAVRALRVGFGRGAEGPRKES